MKKYLLLILMFFVCGGSGFALEIVYPKTNPAKIDANSTFFIGSANPFGTLKINDAEVKVSPSGAFAQVVPLNVGINNFKIISYPLSSRQSAAELGDNFSMDFVIERPQPAAAAATTPALLEYPVLDNFYVSADSTPLRMTPIDAGINRLSHLLKGTRLLINGEKGDFYRVYLNSKLFGWVKKSDTEQKDFTPPKTVLKGFKIKEEKDFCIYEFELEGKPPFTLKEENGLTLQLFNIEGQDDSTYSINIPTKKLIGYDAYYDGDKFILKIRKIPEINIEKPLKNVTIAVDAGHGGSEFGAIGGCGDKEKDINLAIAKNLKQELENRGAKVVMTREDDVNVSLTDRVKIAKDKDASLLISVHANALPDGADPIKCRGTSVYYYHNQAKPLADDVLNSMTAELGTQNDKVRQGSLALVRPTSSVSILIEVAYIINPDDYCLLLDENFRTNCAKSIADGIEKYILN
ncbi:MAG: N-acetylmuramoyl-L-alanine amidase [Candidatus Gastranaerophilaceae bacterium]